MAKSLNTKLDALTYVCKKLRAINERYCMYFRDNPYSTEALFYAYRKTKKASGWKGSTQKYSHEYLTNIQELFVFHAYTAAEMARKKLEAQLAYVAAMGGVEL